MNVSSGSRALRPQSRRERTHNILYMNSFTLTSIKYKNQNVHVQLPCLDKRKGARCHSSSFQPCTAKKKNKKEAPVSASSSPDKAALQNFVSCVSLPARPPACSRKPCSSVGIEQAWLIFLKTACLASSETTQREGTKRGGGAARFKRRRRRRRRPPAHSFEPSWS